MVVIDEQHRFGVHQRLTLTGKGTAVDVLVMTATPIPRTLMLTAYGDMDVSRLTDRPPGRPPLETRTLARKRVGLGKRESCRVNFGVHHFIKTKKIYNTLNHT